MSSFIGDEVRGKVFKLFEVNKFEEGRKILQKLYLKYYDSLEETEDKRLIIHNLCVVESYLDNYSSLKLYSKKWKEDIEKDTEYIKNFKEYYCDALGYYYEANKEDLPIEESIKINEYNLNYYKEIGAYLESKICEFNIAMIIKDLDKVLIIIEDLHTNNINKKYEATINNFLDNIKKTNDTILYNKALNLGYKSNLIVGL